MRFAKLIKREGEKSKALLRRIHRLKSTDLISTKSDLIQIATRMHAAMVADNIKNNGVVKAARMCGLLSHRPTIDGLETYHGSDWDKFPLGSSRLVAGFMDQRLTLVPANGCPLPPDWRLLRDLRRRRHFRRSRGVESKVF